MISPPQFTETVPDGIPPAFVVLADMRRRYDLGDSRDLIVTDWTTRHPELALLAAIPVLADWLGILPASAYAARSRTNAAGRPMWPDPDPAQVILGHQMWTFAEVVMHRASALPRGWNLRDQREGAQ